jgi:ankyrin repeat protein
MLCCKWYTCKWYTYVGLDLSLPNKQGHTALHKAAYKGHDALCRWLIANTCLGCNRGKVGADTSVVCCVGFQRDAGGYTPAMIAREQRHEALAAWLQAQQEASAEYCPAANAGGENIAAAGDAADVQMKLTGPLGKLEIA